MSSSQKPLRIQVTPALLKKIETNYTSTVANFAQKHPDVLQWLREKSAVMGQVGTASQQLLASASIVGSMAMQQPVDVIMQQQLQTVAQEKPAEAAALITLTAQEQHAILEKATNYLQQLPPGHLPEQEELYLEQQLSDMLGFAVTAELEGNRLNHSIGIMGGEQHLMRFPGDTLEQHDDYREAGIAPNRGAFGWFTESGVLTEQAIQREKYYFAVQTMYLPDWNANHATLKPWYKFRKMIVVNPAESVAVVGVVGDAGPAQWVNKQFGGSPAVIREGKIWSPTARGKILLFFVDDPSDTIPLGPISLEPSVVNTPTEAAATPIVVPTPAPSFSYQAGVVEEVR